MTIKKSYLKGSPESRGSICTFHITALGSNRDWTQPQHFLYLMDSFVSETNKCKERPRLVQLKRSLRYPFLIMEYFCRRRWTTGSALSVSYSVHEDKSFLVSELCSLVFKFIYHGGPFLLFTSLYYSAPWLLQQVLQIIKKKSGLFKMEILVNVFSYSTHPIQVSTRRRSPSSCRRWSWRLRWARWRSRGCRRHRRQSSKLKRESYCVTLFIFWPIWIKSDVKFFVEGSLIGEFLNPTLFG